MRPRPHSDEVVDSGKLMLFDAFWDADNKLMRNNLCPAEVIVTEEFDPNTGITTEVETVTATDIDVTETIIQVDDIYEYTLTQEDITRYSFLDDEETDVGVGSTVWWLRLDNPDTEDVDEGSGLQLGFSTDRFDSAHWWDNNEQPFEFHFIAIREDDVPEHEHGHFYAFDPVPSDGESPGAIWSSEAADANDFPMWPRGGSELDGSGDEPTTKFTEWVFTKPGYYMMETHLKGTVRNTDDPPKHKGADWMEISEHETETTVAVIYTFHVGPLIDLGVDLQGTLDANATSTVSYTVTASNSGLDPATNPVVQINLPEGLEFVHDDTPNTQVFHNNGTVTWDVGELAAPATSTLTFTAAVTAAGAGQKLTADAEIRDLEYNEVDQDHSNNSATATVTPATITKNRGPLWSVELSVPENSPQGTAVGAPVAALDADMDTLDYTLSGSGAEKFTVDDASGQISVAADAGLDYETKWSYQLILNVSDGKDASGGVDTTTIDQSMAVNISLDDVDENTFVTLAASVSTTTPTTVTITATPTNLPEGYTDLEYGFSERSPLGYWISEGVSSGNAWERVPHGSGTYHYVAFARFTTAEGHSVTVYAHPINVEVTVR